MDDGIRKLQYRMVAGGILDLFTSDPAPGSEWESDILHARRWATATAPEGIDPELDGTAATKGTTRVAAFLDEYYDGVEVLDGTAVLVEALRDWGRLHRKGGLLDRFYGRPVSGQPRKR